MVASREGGGAELMPLMYIEMIFYLQGKGNTWGVATAPHRAK